MPYKHLLPNTGHSTWGLPANTMLFHKWIATLALTQLSVAAASSVSVRNYVETGPLRGAVQATQERLNIGYFDRSQN